MKRKKYFTLGFHILYWGQICSDSVEFNKTCGGLIVLELPKKQEQKEKTSLFNIWKKKKHTFSTLSPVELQ